MQKREKVVKKINYDKLLKSEGVGVMQIKAQIVNGKRRVIISKNEPVVDESVEYVLLGKAYEYQNDNTKEDKI